MQPNSKTTAMKKDKKFSYTFISIPTNVSISIIQESILPETQTKTSLLALCLFHIQADAFWT